MPELALRGGKATRSTPFSRWPVFGEPEHNALIGVLESGTWGIGGAHVDRFAEEFARLHDARHAVCVSSGTAGLDVALRACGVRAGDEVIVPAYTFAATATAVAAIGAIPVFVDIEPDTYNIDPAAADAAVTERTRAVVPVHIAGRPADLDAIMALAKARGLRVVEDACQAPGASWRDRKVGAIGDIGVFSFQSSKNLNCGEGGIVITNDDAVAERAWSYHNCGRVPDGAWYEHNRIGTNSRMTEFQAALLSAQLTRFAAQAERRERNARMLERLLADAGGILPMRADPRVTGNARHLFILRYGPESFGGAPRSAFIAALNAEGIPCSSGYVPLYRQKAFLDSAATFPLDPAVIGRTVRYASVSCPVVETACNDEGVWLTQNMLLGDERDVEDIAAAVMKIRRCSAELRSYQP